MGYTLRNVFFLLVLGLVAVKGLGHFAEIGKEDRAALVQRVSGQTAKRDEAQGNGDQELVLKANRFGHFTVTAWIEGEEIPLMVDTGASTVILSPGDAERLGFFLSELDYNAVFWTANGEALAAWVTLPELRIGDLELDEVKAAVMESPMAMSLFGMTALDRLAGFEVEGDRMTLRW